eukprot:m.241333 g.241333  ORF g.241333 m.241333 type:complete len:418 (-) comp13830_c0_seq1:127-1380(-)
MGSFEEEPTLEETEDDPATEREESSRTPHPDGLDDRALDALQHGDSWIDPFPSLSNDDLRTQLEAAQSRNEQLRVEMEMYEAFLARATAKYQEETEADEAIGPQAGRRRRSRQQRGAKTVMEQLQLTIQQKCDVAASALDDTKATIDRADKIRIDELCDAEAALEESAIRLDELRKLQYDFERDVIGGAVLESTGKIDADALERHLRQHMRARDLLIEQLQLQDARLKVARAKVERHVRQREEAGEALHEVDFRQLQIENSQIVNKTNECNAEMLRLKLSAGTLAQVLNEHNRQLARLKSAVASLGEEIGSRSGLLQRLVDEMAQVEEQRRQAQELNTRLRKQNDGHRAAPVLDYVKEAAARHQLEREVASLARKVEVAQGELRRVRSARPSDSSAEVRVAFGATVSRTTARGRWGT